MKLEMPEQDVMIADNFEQRDVAIGDVAFILDLLSDKIYSDKELAIIRELSCNAHDSHVVAGTQDVPFDIHLPTQLEPWFCIRDYGTGLADDEIADIYSAIGVSTKRHTNELIGAFGVGSLSPYSMCDSFTVRSFQYGVVRTYQCMRDEKRVPKVLPLGEASTDEPNGLEIKLTVAGKVSQFETAAEKVFLFWDGTIPNINNQHVVRKCEQQRDAYIFQGDDFGLTPSWGNMMAVMGNICYKIPSQLDEFRIDGYLKFDLGELEFDTARENLSMTDKTKAALSTRFASVKDKLGDIAIAQIEEQDTLFGKAKIAENLSKGQLGRFVGRKNLDCYALPKPAESVTCWQSKYRGSEKYNTHLISATGDIKYYLHKDRMQARIKSYLKDMSSGHTMYIFKDLAQALECNIPVEMLEDLDGLPKVTRLNKSSSITNKEKVFLFNKSGYSHYINSDCWNEYELDTNSNKEVVYVEISRWKPVCNRVQSISGTIYQLTQAIKALKNYANIDVELVGLKTLFLNSAKFRKGNFIHIDDYLKREIKKVAPTSHCYINHHHREKINALDSVIDSSCVCDCLKIITNSKKNQDIIECIEKYDLFPTNDIVRDEDAENKIDEFFKKYSMLNIISAWEVKAHKSTIAEYLEATVKNS